MKFVSFKLLILSFVFISSLAACKDDEDLETPLTPATVAGTYKLTALTYKTAISVESSIMDELEPCKLDDTYEFNADGSAVYTDAGISCNSGTDIYNFSWDIVQRVINISDLQLSDDLDFPGGDVKQFDGTTIVIEAKVKNEQTNNIQVTFTATFVKQ